MRIRRWIEKSLLLAGVVAAVVWVGANAIPAVWQDWLNWDFDRQIRGQPRTVPRPINPAIIGKGGLVGRLSIPRLHLSAIVREGAGEETLDLGVGHIPSTALPGQQGNVGVAGHRDTLFRSLRNIRKDDLIQFETLAGNYVYQVGSTEIVTPQNVGVLKPNRYSELTLVTCYPFYYVGPAPQRFIVKARQVSPEPLGENPSGPRPQTTQHAIPARRVLFNVSKNHSRELAPGISLGVTGTDVADHSVDGWMWLMPDRRTIWLRRRSSREPLVFYGGRDGRKHELRITAVSQSSVTGYLALAQQ